ncbi:MAG: extracellular solute-binding protein [Alphaproteobacteria bacterium]|nr:extracellular solute-binding protein [Alphaproteobacteria bacterium]
MRLGLVGRLMGWVVVTALATGVALPAAAQQPVHALALHGEPKYPASFTHFDYTNPAAPKGGDVRLGTIGTFDSLNQFILRGVPAVGLSRLYDSLTVASGDEPFTQYGLLAESMELAPDRTSIAFNLRAEARFHDGRPVTAEDVVWTFQTLREKGRPIFRSYYADVVSVTAETARRVVFRFRDGNNRELPLIVGQIGILPKHYYETVEFERTTLTPPIGSGPYRIDRLEPGRSITYRLDPNYWGRNLPVNRGRQNFATIRHDYYRDQGVLVEALKAGEFDWRQENAARLWSTAYDTPAVRDGHLRRETIQHQLPMGMQAYSYNTRRPLFQDRRVRQALGMLYDFELVNRTVMFGLRKRSYSYFTNSEMAATGLPDPEELAILERYRGRVPDEVFTRAFQPPVNGDEAARRTNRREALRLLTEAGWTLDGRTNRLLNRQGEQMRFEVLLNGPLFEPHTLPWIEDLKRIGIDARVRTVDPSQYQARMDAFDFDVTADIFPQSSSPGNEQRNMFNSAAADAPGSSNSPGIKDPVVDELVERLINSPDRASLVLNAKVLDRVLLWGHYVVPQWHDDKFWLVYWNMFDHPQVTPKFGFDFDAWWVDDARLAGLPGRRAAVTR